jgi:hypothetical protein
LDEKIILIGLVGLIASCGGVIKDVSFETGDYLGTGYDDKPQKKVSLSKSEKKRKQRQKQKRRKSLS